MKDNTLKILGTVGIVTTGLVLCVREICKALPTTKDKLLKDTFEDPLFASKFGLDNKSDEYTEGFDAGFEAGYKEAETVYSVPTTDPFESAPFSRPFEVDPFSSNPFNPALSPFVDGFIGGLFEGATVHIDTLNIGDGYYINDDSDEESMEEFDEEVQAYKDCTDSDETGDEPDDKDWVDNELNEFLDGLDEEGTFVAEFESEEGTDLEDIPQVEIPKKKTATPGTTGTDYMTPKEEETAEKTDEEFFNDAVSNVMK